MIIRYCNNYWNLVVTMLQSDLSERSKYMLGAGPHGPSYLGVWCQ